MLVRMNRFGIFSTFAVVASFALVGACVSSDPAAPYNPGDAGNSLPDATPLPGNDAGDTIHDDAGDGGASPGCEPSKGICDGKCVDTSSSADHCGACGHSCGGGKCESSVCTPVVVASNLATPPSGVAVTGKSVFWIRNGAIERCPAEGCTGAPFVVTSEVSIGAQQPGGTTIVTDGNQVAWIATGTAGGNGRDIFACDVIGCNNGFPPRNSGTSLNAAPVQLALQSSTLFAAQSTGSQRQGPIATLVMTGIFPNSDSVTGIAADTKNIYVAGVFQSSSTVMGCPRVANATCTPSHLFVGATYLAAGGGFVFATSSEGIKSCASTGCGGSATVLDANDKAAAAIAANDTIVAWVNPGDTAKATGSVRICALPDCAGGPKTIADAQEQPVSVTLSGGFVYWANRGVGAGKGSIWRAAF